MSNDETTESAYQIPHELVALREKSGENHYRVSLSKAAKKAGIEKGSKVTVQLDLQETPPMMIIGAAPDDADLPGMEVRTFHQKILLPNKDLADLGLDLETYDNQNPFLFMPHILEEMIALEPLGYASNVLDDQAPDKKATIDGDEATKNDERDVSEGGTEIKGVSVDDITATSNATGVPESELKQALGTIEAAVDRDELDGILSDEFDPVREDEREWLFVESDTWERLIANELGLNHGDTVVNAVRLAFNRSARDVIGDDRDYRRFDKTADAVVLHK